MTSDVLDQTIDLETEEVVSSATRTLLKRSPRSAGSFSAAAGPGGLTEIQPLETTDPDAPCVAVILTTCQQRDVQPLLAGARGQFIPDDRVGRIALGLLLGRYAAVDSTVSTTSSRLRIDFRQFVGDVEWLACAESSSG